MAAIFYGTGGNFSALTPQTVVSSYLTPLVTSTNYDALNTTRYIAFTPSVGGDCDGVMLCLATGAASSSVTAVLQEFSGGLWVDRQTKTLTTAEIYGAHNVGGFQLWTYFQWPATHPITAVAGVWRIAISSPSSSWRLRKNAANYGHAVVITTGTVYAAGSDVVVRDGITLTVDQSITIVTLVTGTNAHIEWANPPAASYTLTVTSWYGSADLRLVVGTQLNPIPTAQKAVIDVTTWQVGLDYENGCMNFEFEIWGFRPTNVFAFLASDAAAGQKDLVLDRDLSADWQVGDTLYAYGSCSTTGAPESCTIQSITATTVTVNVNLTAKHPIGWVVVNWNKRLLCGVELPHSITTSGQNRFAVFNLSGVYVSGAGVAVVDSCGYALDTARIQARTWQSIFLASQAGVSTRNFIVTANYGLWVIEELYAPLGSWSNSGFILTLFVPATIRYLFSGSSGGAVGSLTAIDSTPVDCQFSGTATGGYYAHVLSLTGCTLTRYRVMGSTYMLSLASVGSTFQDCTFDGGSSRGIVAVGNVISTDFNNCDFGQAQSTVGAFYGDAKLIQVRVNDCSDFTVANVVGVALVNSYIKAHNYDRVANDHRSWWQYGLMQSSGDALVDVTVHTAGAGKFAVRFEPQSAANLHTWTFIVPTGNILGQTMTVAVWVKINNAAYYAGTHEKPRLTINFDNGTTAYAEALGNTNWQLLSVTFTPTTAYGQITITISGRTDAAGTNAYFYVDDFAVLYPAGYKLDLGGLDLWADGLPITPPIATVLSAADVWQVADSTLTGAGTIGKRLTDYVDAAVSTRLATASYSAAPSAAAIADAVLDEDAAGHTGWLTKLLSVAKFLGLK